MNQVIPFIFDEYPIRTMMVEDSPWWVGKDVCNVLEYKNPNDAMNDHCRGVAKRYPIVDSLGRKQEVRIINEGDVFRLIVNSRLPQAQRFEKWLFEEVLPQIRRTGGYGGQKELEDMKTRLMRLELNENTYAALLKNALRTVRRFENRSLLTKEDKREIMTLYVQEYPVSAIQKITKKSRTRIKNFINEILSDDEEADALFKEWEQDDEDKIAASRGKVVA
jgi:prophage antirepressor-like protein